MGSIDMKILYGTGNKAKVEAMKKIIKVHGFDAELFTIKDIGFDQDVEENGITFEENSEIKARAIKEFCDKNNINDKIIITDDAGLCVDVLNGEQEFLLEDMQEKIQRKLKI